jgi:hypothetical protein
MRHDFYSSTVRGFGAMNSQEEAGDTSFGSLRLGHECTVEFEIGFTPEQNHLKLAHFSCSHYFD